MRFWFILLLIIYSATTLAARQMTIISLQNADPELLIRAIRPQLSTGSSINRYQDQLLINATAEELSSALRLIKQLDGSGQQLIFSLRREGNTASTSRRIAVNGQSHTNVSNGNNTHTETRITVKLKNRGFAGSNAAGQGVRGTEGSAVYIATGLNTLSQQQPALSGFYATAWLDRDNVSIHIDQSDGHFKQGKISTQQLQSRVSGALGTWIPIGAIVENTDTRGSELNSHAIHGNSHTVMLYLKVDALP